MLDKTHFKDQPPLGGSMKRKIVNPDLAEERAKCDFNKEEFARMCIPE